MRVLLLSNVFPPQRTTRATQVFRVASGLSRLGLDVHVLTRGPAVPKEQFQFEVHSLPPIETRQPGHWLGHSRSPHALRAWARLRQRRQWVRAVKQALRSGLVASDFKVVLSFSNPFENHQAARSLLPLLPGAVWLAYWSDPWPSTLQCGPYYRSSILARLLYERQARRALQTADANLFPNPLLPRHFESALGINLSDSCHLLPHIGAGKTVAEPSCQDRGWITHLGTLGPERVHRALIDGVVRAREALGRETFRGLRLIGKVDPGLRALANELGAGKAIRIEPPILPDAVGSVAESAQALLVVEAPMDKSVYSPSKFADYARSRRPVLSISPIVAALREMVAGRRGSERVVFCEYDANQICTALCAIFGEEEPPNSAPSDSTDSTPLSDYYSESRICSDLKDLMTAITEKQ